MPTLVEKVCQQCDKTFPIKVADAKRGRGKFCSRPCQNQSRIGKHWPQELHERMSVYRRAHPNSGQFPKGHVSQNKGIHLSEATKEKLSRNHADVSGENNPMYGKHRPQRVKDAIREAQIRRYKNSRERRILAEKIKKLWENPEYIAKVIKGRAMRPTQPEQKLIEIVDRYFPEFKYNGNFDEGIILNHLIPDFVNVNGKKELIEVFGDYFHSSSGSKNKWHRSELGRVMAYNSIGWKCLIIWEHELKELSAEQITEKINRFFGGKHHVAPSYF